MTGRFLAAAVAMLLWSLPAVAQDEVTVARGRYLATLGDCEVCHTQPGRPDRLFAGGYALHAYFGTVYSPNITPDKETGIGNWTSNDFYHALHGGVAADGHYLYPAFPYPYFHAIPRRDSDALFAYLKTIRPIHQRPPANDLILPARIRWLMLFWDWLFDPQDTFHPDPSQPPLWNRGGELVHGIGHCGDCHTPKNVFFAQEGGKNLHGTVIDGWYAPDLTGTKGSGLGDWSEADIEQFLKTGVNRFTRVTGSMQDVVRASTSRWTDDDRKAVALYLKSLPSSRPRPPAKPDEAAMQDGQTVFVESCSACHAADKKDYPPLAHNSTVLAVDPTTVLHVLLQGSQFAPTPNGPTGYSMPAFASLDDRQIADVATYIRNSWGNRARPVTPQDVTRLRALLN